MEGERKGCEEGRERKEMERKERKEKGRGKERKEQDAGKRRRKKEKKTERGDHHLCSWVWVEPELRSSPVTPKRRSSYNNILRASTRS